MDSDAQKIRIIGVDKEGIIISHENKEHWIIPFKLSVVPEQTWQTKLYEVLNKNKGSIRRKVSVSEDCLVVEVSAADDLQKVLEVLKVNVAQVNELCEEDSQMKLKIRKELEAMQKKQNDRTMQFKQDSDKLIF